MRYSDDGYDVDGGEEKELSSCPISSSSLNLSLVNYYIAEEQEIEVVQRECGP